VVVAEESAACSCFFSSPQPASANASAIARPLAVTFRVFFTRSSILFRSPLDVPMPASSPYGPGLMEPKLVPN
jgi:hypothetical protein